MYSINQNYSLETDTLINIASVLLPLAVAVAVVVPTDEYHLGFMITVVPFTVAPLSFHEFDP